MKFKFLSRCVLVLALFLGHGNSYCFTDEDAMALATADLEHLDRDVSEGSSMLNHLGRSIKCQVYQACLANYFSKETFAEMGDTDATPFVPHEILSQFIDMLSSDLLIHPCALPQISAKMGEWVAEQRSAMGDESFASRGISLSGAGLLPYPRFSAALVLAHGVRSLVSATLMQWSLMVDTSPDDCSNALSAVKQSLRNFLFNFYKHYYLPISELFCDKYGKDTIAHYKAYALMGHGVEIQKKVLAIWSATLAASGIAEESLFKTPPLDATTDVTAEDRRSDGVSSSPVEPSAHLLRDVRAEVLEEIASIAAKSDFNVKRLEHLSCEFSERELRSTLQGLLEKISNVDMFLLSCESDSWDLIGSDLRTLLNRALDSSQQISLDDIQSAVLARNAYIEEIVAAVPANVLYGLPGQQDFQKQATLIFSMRVSLIIIQFCTTLVMKKINQTAGHVDKAKLRALQSSCRGFYPQFVDAFLDVHGEGAALQFFFLTLSQVNAMMEAECPKFFN